MKIKRFVISLTRELEDINQESALEKFEYELLNDLYSKEDIKIFKPTKKGSQCNWLECQKYSLENKITDLTKLLEKAKEELDDFQNYLEQRQGHCDPDTERLISNIEQTLKG